MRIDKQAFTTPEIEQLQFELKNRFLIYGLNCPQALKLSQRLDKLIVIAMKQQFKEQ